MSYTKPFQKNKSTASKVFFILSIIFAGPVSFFLYDYYVTWSQNGNQTISWYLAFAYDLFGAWGGVLLALGVAAACYCVSYYLYKRNRMYYWS